METTEKIIAVMQKKIAVMQGHQDGKAVQYRPWHGGTWINASSTPLWNWPAFDYRVKPEPKKVMMQMWRHPTFGDVSYPVGFEAYLCMQPVSEKIGEPFEFTYPEESE